MAYVAGDLIKDDEYNTFVNSSSDPFGYNHFAGTGSGVYGLGQTHIATVDAGATISASNWNALFTGMDNIANHTNDSITSTSVQAGSTVAIKSAIVADLASLAAEVAAGCTSATAVTTNAVGTSTNSGTWNSTSTIERSVTFANADTMRHFFNAGGKIRIDPTCVTGIDGDKDTVFNDLTTTAIGNLDLGAHATTRSGSGETLTTNGLGNGFHDLGTGYTTLIKLTSDNSGYTSNTVEISAKLNAAVGTGVTLTVKMVSTDADNDDTYDSPNTSGVPSNPNEAPRMTLALIEVHPTNAQGLAAAIQVDSNAEVSNSAS
jgi:hypothetical protein|tara:strand:+ start:396 stop:1349 length:954 start_codon:yes stop_codon:yes gene_type:complete